MTVSELDPLLETYKKKILKTSPELRDSRFILLDCGWNSHAVDVDDRLMFRFPQKPEAFNAIRHEARMLEIIRPHVDILIPSLRLIGENENMFSVHEKIPGGHLLADDYDAMTEEGKDRVAKTLADFFADLHALPSKDIDQRNIIVSDYLFKDVELLPHNLQMPIQRCLQAYHDLPPDPHGNVFGYFDAHGWNLAFDEKNEKLNGIFDFAEVGIVPLHMEFVMTGLISYDLTERIVEFYERRTKRMIDRRRLTLLAGAYRMYDFTACKKPDQVAFIEKWIASKHAQSFLSE